ncbi:unnamed protein product [Parajaminaea phylloscopi]
MADCRVAVVGAGPVGCLAAISLANRGFKVDIYERRPDPRSHQIGSGSGSGRSDAAARAAPVDRSINLAISARGLQSLGRVKRADGDSLADVVLRHAVPMRARMIHTRDEGQGIKLMSQAYSTKGECINSVSRGLLNTLLLDEADAHPRIEVHFSCKLRSIQFDAKQADPNAEDDCRLNFDSFRGDSHPCARYVAFVIGTDGINSLVRSSIARVSPMDFQQEYIDSEYLELRVPPTKSGEYALDPNHLHIWPRHSFMLIALANLDHSFTSTLFAPAKILARLTTREAIVGLFESEFPDALELMGKDAVVELLLPRQGKGSSLSSIKCNPYHYKGQAIILGDASHAMLPFYGQGLNCGFEDVSVMIDLLDQRGDRAAAASAVATRSSDRVLSVHDSHLTDRVAKAFAHYSGTRHEDLLAISYLASQNYVEMSSSVVNPLFLLRKRLDAFLMATLPAGWWSSLYNLVTFSPDVGYAEAKRTEDRQKLFLERAIVSMAGLGVAGILALGRSWWISRR